MAYFFDETPAQRRERYLRPVAEHGIGVFMGIIFPFTPVTSLYRGDDPQKVASQTIASALTSWLIAQSLGAQIPLGGIAAARGPIFGTLTRPLAPAAIAVGTTVVALELQQTLHSNVGMEEIPGSEGGYTNPMGGSDETYYPFKGLVDYIFG